MKRKLMTRILAIGFSAIMLLSCAGCGEKGGSGDKVVNKNPQIKEDTTTLDIMIYAKGYGMDWLTATIEAFKAKHEGVEVKLTSVNSMELMKSDIKATSECETDLYFSIVDVGSAALVDEFRNIYNTSQGLRELTDVYNTKIPGEEITLGEKMNSSIRDAFRHEGRDTADESDDVYYGIPYVAGTMGMYYNETVIDNALGKGNWSVPRTTNEFMALCERLESKGCYIMTPGMLNQWSGTMFLSWWSQYEGRENYLKFYDGIGYDSTRGREVQQSYFIYEQPGRLAALKTSYDMLNTKTGYALKNSIEINSNNLNEYQTRFTLSEYKYAFYPCGDWLMQELSANSTVASNSVIKMMKTPVISSIIESTDSYSGSDDKRLPNITSDDMLAKVVAYVDGEGELPQGVTDEEVAIVKEARNTVGSKASSHFVFAPVFSDAQTLANEFLLFMASDEGIQIFKDNCKGSFAPYAYEYKGLDESMQSIYNVSKDAVYVEDYTYNKLFFMGGINGTVVGNMGLIDTCICTPNGLNAEEIHKAFLDAYSGNKWDKILNRF